MENNIYYFRKAKKKLKFQLKVIATFLNFIIFYKFVEEQNCESNSYAIIVQYAKIDAIIIAFY